MSVPAVVARALTKRYGHVTAVDGLDLEVPYGSVFGLLGPNGAGKSTTFGILCGWLRADGGIATVLDTPSADLSRLRGKVSAMPQDAAFPPQVPVHRQLTYYGVLGGLDSAAAAREATRVLDLVGLGEVANRRGNQLSHGMLKRVALAQALIGSPRVLFLDEPTAGLDPASARHIKDIVAGLAPAATVIVSSHNLGEIQEICTHGSILDHGKRVAVGTIAELTHTGTQIHFELGEGASPPMAELAAVFGGHAVALIDPSRLRIVCPPESNVADAIGRALRILLDHAVPILGVQRGTTLESAFLEATRASSAAQLRP